MIEWKEAFSKHGLRVTLEKTGVFWVVQKTKDLDLRLEGKKLKLKLRDSFVYLGGAACGDADAETEISRTIQTGGGTWRKLRGLMGDRYIYRKLKGEVLSSSGAPAYLYGIEIIAMTGMEQEKGQVYKNN